MSAETLRRAATLMRERAEAVEGWYTAPAWATTAPMNLPIEQADAEHIASWHPAVALAVADWLETSKCALHCDDDGKRFPYCSACEDSGYDHECPRREVCRHAGPFLRALAVARAYLGEAS